MTTCPTCHLLVAHCTCPGGAYERHVAAQRERERAQRAQDATEGLALFAADAHADGVAEPTPPAAVPGLLRGLAARDTSAAHHADLLDQLVPIAHRVARAAGHAGATISDVRADADAARLLAGLVTRAELSFLGKLMERAGLVSTGRVRRSAIDGSHANRHSVWLHWDFADDLNRERAG